MSTTDVFLFVSHVAQNRAAALEIVDELERRGARCWIAPRNIRPGRAFDDEIAEAIENSRAMVLIFSDLCNDSEYIRREVTVAGESHKPIIPFRIEDVRPRKGLRVRLSDLHWIDGFISREKAIDELLNSYGPGVADSTGGPRLRDLDEGKEGPPATVVPPPKAESGPRTSPEAPDPHVMVQPPNGQPTIDAPPIVPRPPEEPYVAPPPVHEPAATASKRRPLLIGGGIAAILAVGVIAILNASGPSQPEIHSTTTSPAPSTATRQAPSAAPGQAAWWIQQGDSARAQGDINGAISYYEMAQQVDPSSGGMQKAAELRQVPSSGVDSGGNTRATMHDQMMQNLQDLMNEMNQNSTSPPKTKKH